MNCKDIKFGTLDCAYNIMLPYLVTDPCNPSLSPFPKTVCIDKCLLPEILELWEMGIKTTGCCCGHGKKEFAYIGVDEKDIGRMKEMGYKVWHNSCRPNDEDSFIPKTELSYGNADRGFNWWDNNSNEPPGNSGKLTKEDGDG